MIKPKLLPALFGLFALLCATFALPGPAQAAPYAAMVIDARSGEVLHSRNADTRLHPASLTKMMTLYIVFEAVRLGEITMDTRVTVSRNAAAEPPSELGIRAGSTIALRYLVRAAAVRSANDAATALAEAIEGSEAAFARRMNRTAHALGMTRTTFRNANGLTEEGHLSTARDMTTMGRRLFYDYPQYYNLFSRRTTDAGIATVSNTNRRFLDAYEGADGIKTGYTRAAGFNLVASAQRGEERIIATVFGGSSTASRNQRIMELLDMGFARAPSHAAVRRPDLPVYDDEEPVAAPTTRANGAVAQSMRPVPRPGPASTPAPSPELIAAIEDVLDEALQEVADEDLAEGGSLPDVPPTPRPEGLTVVAATREPRVEEPIEIEPEVVVRASSTGTRLYGVSLGRYPSRHAAERLLLQTALAELGTFDDALRNVVARTGGFDAQFAGMTEDQAERACRRLMSRNQTCTTYGP